MPTPDSAPFGFYIIVGAFMSLLGFHFLRWVRQQFSSADLDDNKSKSFSVHIVEGTSSSRSSQQQWLWDTLSAREIEVARLAANGQRNSEIARDLHISVRTVETHMKHIYTKLDVRSRVELARIIRELVD